MRKNAEKMDLSSCNRLLRIPAGSHGFWAHDPLPDPSHDLGVDPWRVTIPLAFTSWAAAVDWSSTVSHLKANCLRLQDIVMSMNSKNPGEPQFQNQWTAEE